MTRLLLADGAIAESIGLRNFLSRHGFHIRHVHTAQEACAAVLTGKSPSFDVVVLEAILPDYDGFKVCARLRKHTDIPVIMVSARSDPKSRIRGLYLGADDYVAKPFHAAELLARIHAIKRRTTGSGSLPPSTGTEKTLDIGPVSIDPARRRVIISGRALHLTYKEYEMLILMARHPGIVFRRDHILSAVWGDALPGSSRTLEVHIANLRAKLGESDIIQTIRGVGYRVTGP